MKKIALLSLGVVAFGLSACAKQANSDVKVNESTPEVVAMEHDSELDNSPSDEKTGCDYAKLKTMTKLQQRDCFCEDDEFAKKFDIEAGYVFEEEDDESDWAINRMRECMLPFVYVDEPESINRFFSLYLAGCDDLENAGCDEVFSILVGELFKLDETGVTPIVKMDEELALQGISYIKRYCIADEESHSACSIFASPEPGCEVNGYGEYQCQK